ncbi:MAG: DNA recombination protein RmuC [Candidatus Saccharimonadales bacterium]
MEILVNALVVAIVVAIVIFAIFKLFGAALMDKYLLSLHKQNEELREKNKAEVSSGVKDLLNADREKLEIVIKQIRDQLKESQGEVKSLQKQSSAITEQLKNTNELTDKLRVSTEGLKNLLSNNRLRGDWGEQVAEDLLLGAGFVENVNFVKQTTTAEGRPDFTIMLPDGTKLNIDAKFPLDDLVNYQEAKTDTERRQSLKSFEKAVKEKVKQVTSKDYIDQEAQTVDFVVMFIPNEMVFSFIYEKLPAIVKYSGDKKVIMTGPFGFTAMLRLILQAYKNFNYQQGLGEILGLVEKFQTEYEKFGESLEKVGRQIEGAQRAFHDVEGTRHRQLTRVVDKIGDYSAQQGLLGTGDDKDDDK